VDFNGIHPVGMTIDDLNYAALFDPPPYFQLAPSIEVSYGNVMMTGRPSSDPPTYRQVAAEKAREVIADNTHTESSVF